MVIKNLLKDGANVQVVVNLSDLRTMFNEWQDERDARVPAKEDVMLSAEDAAKQLGVTSVTLWRWAREGYLSPTKVGRKNFYWKSNIDKLTKKEVV